MDPITITHTYYRQSPMVEIHRKAWAAHKMPAYYSIVDDGSPEPLQTPPFKNLNVYRIRQDIPWNIAGARNLGFHTAKTDWVLSADIDHVVTAEALEAVMQLDRSNPKTVHLLSRRTPEGQLGVDAVICCLMNRATFFEMGGYDEDFSGCYGREETFFWHCLRSHKLDIVRHAHIELAWYPKMGATARLSRDRSKNVALYDQKMLALGSKSYQNGPILRFEWQNSG